MSPPIGICKLCRNEKPLVSSHFLPARLYEYCRQEGMSPIKMGETALYPTDRQTQDYLLCDSCEDVLNAGGETWVGPKLATWERTFPLFELLSQQQPDYKEDGFSFFFASQNPQIRVEKIVHFAMGIFWKASVHSWIGTSRVPRLELGPYSERIRTWLKGETVFPRHVYLSAIMATPRAAQIAVLEPYRTEASGWHSFMFHVPGILFTLDIGKTVEASTRWMCLNQNTLHPLAVCDEIFGKIAQLMTSAVQKSRKTKAFERAMQKAAIVRNTKK